ncbi:MAG: glucosylceramidase [Firmicutes bacterium]|nr:glucosylceramidase [Bacillota bacterium]
MRHYKTKKDAIQWLEETEIKVTSSKSFETITIDPLDLKQTIIGFGGAFTEASAYNLSRIDSSKRQKAIEAYFDPIKGLGYSIGRVSIHGCDFSLGSYLYIKDYDDSLESFDISRDQPIIDLIKDSEKVAKQPIKILGSPWTPPFWMKDNQSPIRGGKLLPKYYQTWADYFVKFIKAYEAKGIDVFTVSVQNEPAAVQRWDSCIFTAEDECAFVKVLGPTLKQAGLEDKHILIWDHNRDIMVERAQVVLSDPEAYQYVWGTAFHWYENEQFQNVKKLHDLFPEKHLLFTEGCQEGGPHFGEYQVGERYGRNMINDLRNYTEGYIDWNLFLDETGGPNHVNNLCSSPMMIKIFHEELIYMPSYYYIGHFSKFIQKGAIQMASSGTEEVLFVSFVNPDGKQVVVIQNEREDDYNIEIKGLNKEIKLTIDAHSISTIII